MCFHSQQCAEKYIKARLQEAGISFPKTHDLVDLLALVAHLEPALSPLQTALDRLTSDAVENRYPGRFATKVEAKDALAIARQSGGSFAQALHCRFKRAMPHRRCALFNRKRGKRRWGIAR